MPRPEAGNRALILVGPQHTDPRRPTNSYLRGVLGLESITPLAPGIVSSFLKDADFDTRLHTMQPGRINALEGPITSADFVFISSRYCDTPLARDAAEIAKRHGKLVIAGGYGPTLTPNLFTPFFDAIAQGEAEPVLGELIADLRMRRLKPVYDARELPPFDLNQYRWPDRTIDKRPSLVTQKRSQEWSRGCARGRCTFCSAVRMQETFRFRTPDDIMAEIRSIGIRPNEFLFLVDLNIISTPRENLVVLFQYLKENKIRWIAEGTVAPLLADLEEHGGKDSLLALMSPQDDKGGCYSFLYGADDLTASKVRGSRDKEKTILANAVDTFRHFGVPLNLSVIVGLDTHVFPNSFFEVANLLEELRPPYAFPNIATPYPGTVWGDSVASQGRVTDDDPLHYNHRRVVFRPAGMETTELQSGYYWLLHNRYNLGQIVETGKANSNKTNPPPNMLLRALLSGLPLATMTYFGNQELVARGHVDPKMLKAMDREYTKWKSTNHEN